MSALAAMFNPPRLRATPTRLVIAGRDVTSVKDIPPLPSADDREKVKKVLTRIAKRKWEAANPEKKRASARKSYEKRKDDPEFQRKLKESQARYYEKSYPKVLESKREWYRRNTEYVMQKQREYRERKRNENRAASTNETSNGHTFAPQGEKRNGANRATAHAKRVQTTSNLQSRMAAPHV